MYYEIPRACVFIEIMKTVVKNNNNLPLLKKFFDWFFLETVNEPNQGFRDYEYVVKLWCGRQNNAAPKLSMF